METIQYQPKGVCSNYMEIDVDSGVIQDCRVKGGCNGNLQGISHLLKGMRVQDAIQRMEGIPKLHQWSLRRMRAGNYDERSFS